MDMISDYKKAKEAEMLQALYSFIDNWEDEIIEFKEAENDYDQHKIGQYFSALSNKANLHHLQYAWLIFGVRNKDKKIVGSNYRDTQGLQTLKNEINHNTNGSSFWGIYDGGRTIDTCYLPFTRKTARTTTIQLPT